MDKNSPLNEMINFEEHLKSDSRNFWWYKDFKELLKKRATLETAHKVLDVGCGLGHWTREMSSLVASDAEMVGVDIEEKWIKQAIILTSDFKEREVRFSFQTAAAYDLPFSDETFDLVTCQTLLMHLGDPQKAISEMMRVLKKTGKIILVEPNNYAHLIRSNTAQSQLTLEEEMDIVKFYAMIEDGKRKLGEGDLGICRFLPKFLKEVGCNNIQFYRNDKAFWLQPPYETDEQKSAMQFMLSIIEKGYFYIFPPDAAKRFFDVVSSDQILFKKLCTSSQKLNEFYCQTIRDKTLEGTMGFEMFIAIGEKA